MPTELHPLDKPIRHILDGDSATLFVGAGISFLAKDKDGKTLPSGEQLKSELQVLSGAKTDRHTLDKYASFFVKKNGPAKLYDILTKRLKVSEVDARLSDLFRQDWRRIYTTNYDDSIEFARQGLRTAKPFTLADEPINVTDGAIVHINGFIERVSPTTIDQDIKLTDYSYSASALSQSSWDQFFRTDLRLSRSIVFVGYSLADLDIARILYDEKALRDKLYFIISPTADEIELEILSTYGSVHSTGVGVLFERIEKVRETYDKSNSPVAYYSISDLSKLSGATGRLPAKLIDDQLIWGEPALKEILAGSAVFDAVPYLVPREQVTKAAQSVIDGRRRDAIIVGSIVSGKSFAALQFSQLLLASGYKVFGVDDGRKLSGDLDRLRKIDDRVCLVVDGYRRYIDELMQYLAQRPKQHVLLLTERAASHELLWPVLSGKFPQDSYEEVVLEDLTDKEIEGFDALINFAGLWPEGVAGRAPAQRHKYVKTELNRNLYRLLLEVIRSKKVQREIETLLAPLKDDVEARNFFTTAFITSVLGLNFWINDWQSFYKLKNVREIIKKHYEQVGHFIEMNISQIRSRPGVTSLYMLRNYIDDGTITDSLIDIYEAAVLNTHGDSEFEAAKHDLVKYSTIEPLFPEKNKLANLVTYYEAIRPIGDTRDIADYWLQYGIACNIHSDFDRAQTAFDNAYARERSKRSPNTKKIDNYYARFQIEKAVYINDSEEAYRLFRSGAITLMKQIFAADNRHYPFKAGRSLAALAGKHYDHWNPSQRKVFLSDCRGLRDKAILWRDKNRVPQIDVDVLIKEANIILQHASDP